ncbi:uncharacterized protein LOC116198945 [Punica granatum]|uniref:Uncharacterized protein LOC116198945 n=1 Tax=Punica granatum TaxID=22663 RepID=A0A218WMI6_PUNGR|nr:uncharacterized protein LOC116198945 [Punica granatum]OWM73689.1 hypothetical protein CDL15_Pgr026789 [Punica granatum]
MRDIVSCFSESSVIVSQSACTSYSHNACISPALIPSVRNAITSLYRTILSSQKQLLITVTWLQTHAGHALTIYFGTDGSPGTNPPASFKLNTSSLFLRKKKGSKPVESPSPSSPRIEVFWDLSNARFDASPEPTNSFYVVAVIDSEIGLILGDMSQEAALKRFKVGAAGGKFSLISRREHCSGNTIYSTRARFGGVGPVHDIVVRFVGENEGLKHPALLVYVDRKVEMRVKRLMWNFRGNQTIFIDGLLVDLMWDLHDWFFNSPGSGYAVFMFRTRSGLDSRLWLEEKLLPQKDEENNRGEFSLLIYASK